MDKVIDARFERVEKALSTLLTSISTYNPSPAHAQNLVQADDELNESLCILQPHQTNHHRLQSLITLSNNLDAQIRDVLQLLTTTRQSLISVPATTFPEEPISNQKISYDELLDYARRISKFTLPDNYRADLSIEPEPSNGKAGTKRDIAEEKDGIDIPITPSNGTTGVENGANGKGTTKQNTELPQEILCWLDPHNQYAFLPWPHDGLLKRGGLAKVQALMESGSVVEGSGGNGVDHNGVAGKQEETWDTERQDSRRDEKHRDTERRRPSMDENSTQPRQEVKQFSLDDLDDDEDDE